MPRTKQRFLRQAEQFLPVMRNACAKALGALPMDKQKDCIADERDPLRPTRYEIAQRADRMTGGQPRLYLQRPAAEFCALVQQDRIGDRFALGAVDRQIGKRRAHSIQGCNMVAMRMRQQEGL